MAAKYHFVPHPLHGVGRNGISDSFDPQWNAKCHFAPPDVKEMEPRSPNARLFGPTNFVGRLGLVAQLVERLNGIQEVRGSIPLGSTGFNEELRIKN